MGGRNLNTLAGENLHALIELLCVADRIKEDDGVNDRDVGLPAAARSDWCIVRTFFERGDFLD